MVALAFLEMATHPHANVMRAGLGQTVVVGIYHQNSKIVYGVMYFMKTQYKMCCYGWFT